MKVQVAFLLLLVSVVAVVADWDDYYDDDHYYYDDDDHYYDDDHYVSSACDTAIGAQCPTCPTYDNYDTLMQACDASCTTTRRSSACRKCLRDQQNNCYECTETNMAALVAGGCTHLACPNAIAKVCPVCPATYAPLTSGNCRWCSPYNETAACDACRADQKSCRQCQRDKIDDLITEGCTRMKCEKAIATACPTCPLQGDDYDDGCHDCWRDDTSAVCVACYDNRDKCSDCMWEKRGTLDTDCAHRYWDDRR